MKATLSRLSPPQYTVPAAYGDQIVRLVRRWDIMPEELLSGLGLSEARLEDPEERLSLETFAALIERARALTGEPGLGFYLGLRKQVSAYGYLGFAAMSAASLGQALDLFVRYAPTLTMAVSLRLEVEGRSASLIVDERGDMGPAREVALISLVVGVWKIGRTLTGRELHGDRAEMTIPEPPYFHRFKHLVPDMRFGQPVNRVVFDAAFLDLPLVQADRAALRLASEQCDRALDALGYRGDFAERVRVALVSEEGFRSLDAVSSHLGMSARTLKRKLAGQGISFSELLDQERRQRAMRLLHASQMSLEEVAERLGYSTLSNFGRAFHRWTGETPAAYRRGHGSRADAARGASGA
jgi:AraC-like DNA-binding protein